MVNQSSIMGLLVSSPSTAAHLACLCWHEWEKSNLKNKRFTFSCKCYSYKMVANSQPQNLVIVDDMSNKSPLTEFPSLCFCFSCLKWSRIVLVYLKCTLCCSTLATSTLLIIFVKMLIFQKFFFFEEGKFLKENIKSPRIFCLLKCKFQI